MKIDEQIERIVSKLDICINLLKISDDTQISPSAVHFLLQEKYEELTHKHIKAQEYRIKKVIPEFEKLSAECNLYIAQIVEKAKRYIGKEPVTITDDINRIVNEYQIEKDTITQEKRNEIYVRLVQHINFLTKKYKNK